MTVNPDLVFGKDFAVADVKYKLGEPDWNRQDLYEVVAFSAAVGTAEAAIVTFRDTESEGLPDVQIGNFRVIELAWPVSGLPAPDAAAHLVHAAKNWLLERGLDRALAA